MDLDHVYRVIVDLDGADDEGDRDRGQRRLAVCSVTTALDGNAARGNVAGDSSAVDQHCLACDVAVVWLAV